MTFLEYKIKELTPGLSYFVRVASINAKGTGSFMDSMPSSLAPGMKPEIINENSGVMIKAITADSIVSVQESSSSILVLWNSSPNENGFPVISYLIEYWNDP